MLRHVIAIALGALRVRTASAHSRIPGTPGERRAWIKYQLDRRGLSLRQLAAANGLASSTVRAALHSPYPKSESLIANALELHPRQLWPERYGPDGKPNRPMGRPPTRRA